VNFVFTWILDLFRRDEPIIPTAPIKAQRKRRPAVKKAAPKITVRKKKAAQ
jgi:hypothetical protein